MDKHRDIAIIGGGPAGISTAIQLKRFDMSPILFEKDSLGGLLRNAHWVENYPGFPEGISGQALVNLLKKHLERIPVDVIYENVIRADYDPEEKRFLLLTNKGTYSANIMVDASGTKPKTDAITDSITGSSPEIKNELMRYIFFDVLSLRKSKNKHVVIIGAGDIAFDYALHLSENESNQITIAYRGDSIKALPLLHRRVLEKPNIHLMSSSVLIRIEPGSECPLRLTFSNPSGAPSKERNGVGEHTSNVLIKADALIGAIGRVPQNDFYSPGLLEKKDLLMAENQLFLIGDVKNGPARQVAIAAGNGIECAMKIAVD